MKKINLLLLTALLAFSIIGCADGAKTGTQADDSGTDGASEPLVVAMELAYPPFETRDEAGELGSRRQCGSDQSVWRICRATGAD